MPTQNLNSFYYPRYKSILNFGQYFDITLASDERNYNEEVVFSNLLIAENDGNRLPINIDLSSQSCSQQFVIDFGQYYSANTLVSKNYYNPNNEDLSCYSAFTGLCDVGLVGTDNGLYTEMSGETLYYSMGIRNDYKFHPHYYDRRFKMHPVTGYTSLPNQVFSGRPKNVIYNIDSEYSDFVGYYEELYGGFYQGFYKLFGFDYEVFPERVNKGWTVETLIKPRNIDQHSILSGQTYLNNIYSGNSGTFFYFGTRAENKYYHFAIGSPESDSGYTRTFTSGLTEISTCACGNTGVTNSECHYVYPKSATTAYHNIGCGCGACTEQIPVQPLDPKFDVVSNALSLRLSGCPANPRICVKYIKITGDCITTGSCETTGVTFQTGYTITEVCTEPIYDVCDYICTAITEDRWVMVSTVFERYTSMEDCDLLNLGGLNDLRVETYQSSINGTTYNLIMPPETHSGGTKENKVFKVRFDNKWFDETWYRLGRLKIYANGYLFLIIENFEEIIPRELNTEKEKQIGVPFNISFGGGTQGLHDHLIFSSSTLPYGPYQQDPELFPNNILSATTYSGLSTDILLEQNFGGTFMGGISQFRMYTEPLGSPSIQHNFRILEQQYQLFNYWCPNCLTPSTPTPTPTVSPTPTPTPTVSPTPTPTPTPTQNALYLAKLYDSYGVGSNVTPNISFNTLSNSSQVDDLLCSSWSGTGISLSGNQMYYYYPLQVGSFLSTYPAGLLDFSGNPYPAGNYIYGDSPNIPYQINWWVVVNNEGYVTQFQQLSGPNCGNTFYASLSYCSSPATVVREMLLPNSYKPYTTGPTNGWYSYAVNDASGNCYNIAGQVSPTTYPFIGWSGNNTTNLINYFMLGQYTGCTECLN